MPAIHVFYDPLNRISHDAELNKRFGISAVVCQLADDYDLNMEDVETLVKRCVELLLSEMAAPA
jgi:hypothetical protein